MNIYLSLKLVHILSATILFGTGLGTAFFMWMSYLSKDATTFVHTTRQVIRADWWFTTPTVILQPITGIGLMHVLNYQFNSVWFASVIGLYGLAGICWVRVVFIQYQVNALAKRTGLQDVRRLMREWVVLGCVAFAALVVIYGLMTFKFGIANEF